MTMESSLRSTAVWFVKNVHYLSCIVIVLLAITSVGNFQMFISKQSLNHWDQESSVFACFLWDAALLLGFVCQHSLMATPIFKDKLKAWLGITVSQRLIYTAASSLTLLFCILKWQSIPEAGLWLLDTRERWFLWLLFVLLHVLAWFLWSLQLVLMDVGEMLGITQIYNYYQNLPQPLTTGKSAHKLQDLYAHVRHPGTLLMTLLLWVHPLMTLDRVLLACWFSCYLVYRHGTTDIHYTFAEKHFTKTVSQKRSTSSVTYDYVED